MKRRPLLVLVLALVTVTAGCVGGGGPAAPDDGGPTTDDPGDGGAGDGGDGGDGGAGDGDPVADDPESLLAAAGSFTTTFRFTGNEASGGSNGEFTYYVDVTNQRSLVRMVPIEDDPSAPASGIEYFSTDGKTYSRIGAGDQVYYSVSEGATFDMNDAYGLGAFIYEDVEGLTRVGTETFDGVTVTRYETQGDGFLGRIPDPGDSYNGGTVTDFNYVALVDGQGLVRYDAWSMTVETDDGEVRTWEWEVEITDVGSTTVDDPDWLDDARAQTQGN